MNFIHPVGVVCDHGGACIAVVFLVLIFTKAPGEVIWGGGFIARTGDGVCTSSYLGVLLVVDRCDPGCGGCVLPSAYRIVA